MKLTQSVTIIYRYDQKYMFDGLTNLENSIFGRKNKENARTCDEVAAVVVPDLEKAGESLLRDATEAPSRMPSSFETITCLDSFVTGSMMVTSTGTISSLKRPARCAAAALRWDSTAKASWFALHPRLHNHAYIY